MPINEQKKQDLQRERLTFTIGGGKLADGASAGAVMVQMFLNKQIEAGKLKGVDTLVVDGNNDDATKVALQAFQQQHKLKAQNGIINRETYAAMVKDGFVLDEAVKEKSAYLKTDGGKKYADDVNNAMLKHELAYVLGSDREDAAIVASNPPRIGFAVAAIQNELKLPITGKWTEKDAAALKEWQKDDSKHTLGEDGKTPVKVEPADGKFDKRTYDALPWDDKTQQGFDPSKFKEELFTKNPKLAAELQKLEDFEEMRRQEMAAQANAAAPGKAKPKEQAPPAPPQAGVIR